MKETVCFPGMPWTVTQKTTRWKISPISMWLIREVERGRGNAASSAISTCLLRDAACWLLVVESLPVAMTSKRAWQFRRHAAASPVGKLLKLSIFQSWCTLYDKQCVFSESCKLIGRTVGTLCASGCHFETQWLCMDNLYLKKKLFVLLSSVVLC